MGRVWGRAETYHWPSDKPVWTITALALTVVAVLAAAGYAYTRKWTYFQQAYLGNYIGSEMRLWSKKSAEYFSDRQALAGTKGAKKHYCTMLGN